MQFIKHQQKNIHPIFSDFDRMYSIYSDKKLINAPLLSEQIDVAFMPLAKMFENYHIHKDINFKNKLFTKLKLPWYNQKNVIVAFSGGKDSIAVVKHYMQAGYNVILYHLKHINFTLTDEWKQVEELAKYWKLPYYIDDITLSGHHSYIEHPMKNMIIANGALQYGLSKGITTKIAFGNYKTSSLKDDNFEFCGGDCIEMWKVYEDIIHRIIPGFKINLVLHHLGDTLNSVCSDKPLLEKSVSCIGRTSLRAYQHKWVLNKYGIKLPQHRCGRCYKCCVEYIYMADHDLQEYNEEYYKYCLGKLKKNYDREDNAVYSEEEVWNHYMFYDIEQSKYYG